MLTTILLVLAGWVLLSVLSGMAVGTSLRRLRASSGLRGRQSGWTMPAGSPLVVRPVRR